MHYMHVCTIYVQHLATTLYLLDTHTTHNFIHVHNCHHTRSILYTPCIHSVHYVHIHTLRTCTHAYTLYTIDIRTYISDIAHALYSIMHVKAIYNTYTHAPLIVLTSSNQSISSLICSTLLTPSLETSLVTRSQALSRADW